MLHGRFCRGPGVILVLSPDTERLTAAESSAIPNPSTLELVLVESSTVSRHRLSRTAEGGHGISHEKTDPRLPGIDAPALATIYERTSCRNGRIEQRSLCYRTSQAERLMHDVRAFGELRLVMMTAV